MGLDRIFGRGRRRTAGDDARTPTEAPGPEAPRAREDEAASGGADGPDDAAGRVAELSYALGQARPDEQRAAAIERLTELRAAGKVSEENFLKEKRRLGGG